MKTIQDYECIAIEKAYKELKLSVAMQNWERVSQALQVLDTLLDIN